MSTCSRFLPMLGLLLAASCGSPETGGSADAFADCYQAEECFRKGEEAERKFNAPDPEINRQALPLASLYYKNACRFDHGQGCIHAALISWMGSDVEQDLPRARSLLEKACDLGDPEGCGRLGDMFDLGWGGARNPERAQVLYRRACDQGFAKSCFDLDPDPS